MLTETLIKDGFKLNTHDICSSNKMVDVKQCKMMHHVDDTKTSLMNLLVVDNVLDQLESNFEELEIERGKQHELLGMNITCQDD